MHTFRDPTVTQKCLVTYNNKMCLQIAMSQPELNVNHSSVFKRQYFTGHSLLYAAKIPSMSGLILLDLPLWHHILLHKAPTKMLIYHFMTMHMNWFHSNPVDCSTTKQSYMARHPYKTEVPTIPQWCEIYTNDLLNEIPGFVCQKAETHGVN